MAQQTITNSCGHQYRYQLHGAMNERARKAKWLTTIPCPECKRVAEAKPKVTSFLAEHESEIERMSNGLLKSMQTIPMDDREQAVRQLEHQISEGLGDEIKREAARRAIALFRAGES